MIVNVHIKGVGCDVASIPRFREKMNNARLVKRIFTDYEQSILQISAFPHQPGYGQQKKL